MGDGGRSVGGWRRSREAVVEAPTLAPSAMSSARRGSGSATCAHRRRRRGRQQSPVISRHRQQSDAISRHLEQSHPGDVGV